MSQKLKVTRTLKFPYQTTVVTANYNLSTEESGNFIRANSTAIIAFFLPTAASNAGVKYQMAQVNTGAVYLVAPTNCIWSAASVNATHTVKSVGSGSNIGPVFTTLCDGTYWNVWASMTAANVSAYTER